MFTPEDENLVAGWSCRLESLATAHGTTDVETLLAFDEGLGGEIAARPDLRAVLCQQFAALLALDQLLLVDYGSSLASFPNLAGYVMEAEIGRGGIGVVYRARELALNRTVAIKMLASGRFADPRLKRRFQQEAETMARLRYPHVVTVYNVGESDGMAYFSMEMLEGGALSNRIHGCAQPERVAAELTLKLCEAVAFAHERGVIHRDLKPANILLDSNGEPKVGDFGLARLMDGEGNLTRSGEAPGTPSYMAPEQISGESTTAVDVYALGAILYELLTGRPPFEGETHDQVRDLVKTSDPVPPRRRAKQVSRDIETICLKCLEKSPQRRFASARALADDLEAHLEHRPISARSTGTIRRFVKWLRRSPGWAATVAAAVVTTAIVASTTVWYLSELQRALAQSQAAETQARAAEAESNENLRKLRYTVFQQELARADQKWRESDLQQAVEILARYIPKPGEDDLRGFLWQHLWWRCHSRAQTFAGHKGNVYSANFSTNGRRLVTAGEDGLVKVWDVATEQVLHSIRPHSLDAVNAVILSDQRRIVTTGDAIGMIDLQPTPSGSEPTSTILARPRGLMTALAISRDEREIYFAMEGPMLGALELPTGKPLWRTPAHADEINFLSLSPDGHLGVTGSSDKQVILWDMTLRRPRAVFTNTRQVPICGRFSPDGRHFALSTNEGQVLVFDAVHWRPIVDVRASQVRIDGLDFSTDGKFVYTGDRSGVLRAIDIGRGIVRPVAHRGQGRIWCLARAPVGDRMASCGSDGSVQQWSARPATKWQSLNLRDACIGSVAVHASSDRLAFFRGVHSDFREPRLYIGNRPELAAAWEHETRQEWLNIQYSKDGRYLAGCCADRHWRFIDIANRQTSVSREPTPYHRLIALRPQEGTLVTGGLVASKRPSEAEHSIFVWDIETGESRKKLIGHTGVVFAMRFSQDGSLLASASGDRTVRLWETTDWKQIAVLQAHDHNVNDIAFSPDGRCLATGSDDRTVRIWDIHSGEPLDTVLHHPTQVKRVAYSPNEPFVYTVDLAGTLRVWSLVNAEPIVSWPAISSEAICFEFAENGHSLVLASKAYPPNQTGTILVLPTEVNSDGH